jgi:Nickel/cobalt transporter regulator
VQIEAVTSKARHGGPGPLRRWTLALAAGAALLAAALTAGADPHHGGPGGGPGGAPHGGGWSHGGGPPPGWSHGGGPVGQPGRGPGGPPPGWGRGGPAGGPWGPGPPPGYAPGGYFPGGPAPAARSWRRGGYLPPADQSFVVGDYARFHLRRPPFGYHWVQIGAQFMLVSSSTGLIFEVVPAM